MGVIESIGAVMFFFGAASMDSESLVIPFVITFVGGAILLIASKFDDSFDSDTFDIE